MKKVLVLTIVLCMSWACSKSKNASNGSEDLSTKNAERSLSAQEKSILSNLCSNRDKFYGDDVVYSVNEVSCDGKIKTSENTQIEDMDHVDWEKFCSSDFSSTVSNKLTEGENSLFIFPESEWIRVTYAKNDIIKMTYKIHVKDNSLVSLFISKPCAEQGKNSDIVYTDKKKEDTKITHEENKGLDKGILEGIHSAQGVVGATCWANPVHKIGGRDVCRSVGHKFYPGILMAVAKKSMIRDCQSANALDLGDCYKKCSTQTHCIYGDNQ